MEKAIEVLELNKILEQLSDYSRLSFRRDYFMSLKPLYDIEQIRNILEGVEEGIKVINKFGQVSFDYIHNIFDSTTKAIKGGILNEEQLYHIATQYDGIINIKSYYQSVKFDDFPKVSFLLDSLIPSKELSNNIYHVISNDLTIYDNASPTLNHIRKEIISKNAELRRRVDSLVRNRVDYLSDQIVTIRNDRYVIPVKSAYKNMVRGIIHDESSSANTVFIEPEEIVVVNNEIATLKGKEREEIERLLKYLSNEVAKVAPNLNKNLNLLIELDELLTRSAFGISYDGITANLSNSEEIKMIGARHPLIDKTKIVANDFDLYKPTNQEYLITGPNTGGKTVSLKTVGLLVLMNQIGLAIPTNQKATLGIFNDIFVDIGDNQNIAESLSTFSSHLAKLIEMVNKCDSKSLLLVDEIGGGTDPLEGEALAMSLLEEFKNRDSLVLATTHYHNLKTFAIESDYIVNCSMTFDDTSLRPTYRLITGVAGKSYAFEIGRSLSLPEYIIERARNYKNKFSDDNSKLVEKLEASAIENENLRNELKDKIAKQDELLRDAKILKSNLEKQKEDLKINADKEVEKMVNKYKEELDELMNDLKSNSSLKLHNVIDAKTKLKDMFVKEENEDDIIVDEIKVNDKVKIKDIDRSGKVISITKDFALVDVNGITIKSKVSALEKFEGIDKPVIKKVRQDIQLTKLNTEVNLIGLTVEEGIDVLDRFINSAIKGRLKMIRVIHGFGTGRLRNGVWDYLKKSKFVSKYYSAGQFNGGGGATIVELK